MDRYYSRKTISKPSKKRQLVTGVVVGDLKTKDEDDGRGRRAKNEDGGGGRVFL